MRRLDVIMKTQDIKIESIEQFTGVIADLREGKSVPVLVSTWEFYIFGYADW